MAERPRRGVLALAATATAALVGAASWAASRVIRQADPHIERETMFGRAIVFNVEDADGVPVRVLAVGRSVQSGTYLGERRFDAPFEYYRAFERAFDANIPIRRVLLIGGGGYAWPKHTLTRHDDLHLDVAEIDPAITDIARRHFFLGELEQRVGERLTILCEDGLLALMTGEGTYDAIVNDSFAGDVPTRSLLSEAGIQAVRGRLAPGGLYLVNVVCGRDLTPLQATVEALGGAFAHVHVVPATDEHFSDDENYLVIATDDAYGFEGGFEVE